MIDGSEKVFLGELPLHGTDVYLLEEVVRFWKRSSCMCRDIA